MTLLTRLTKLESQISTPVDALAAVADLFEAVTGCQSEGNPLDRLGVALEAAGAGTVERSTRLERAAQLVRLTPEQLLDHAVRGFPVVFKDSLATHRGDVVVVRRYPGVDIHEAVGEMLVTLPDNGQDP